MHSGDVVACYDRSSHAVWIILIVNIAVSP